MDLIDSTLAKLSLEGEEGDGFELDAREDHLLSQEENNSSLFFSIHDICKSQFLFHSCHVFFHGVFSIATKALELLNFTPLNGKPIRVAYFNREGISLRKSGLANIFVKNLNKAIDHGDLHKIFSKFGNIISSKVETDSFGQSKGYGFVQYDNEEAARNAIQQLNGVTLHGKELYVGPFVSKQDREMSVDKTQFTNVYVKNISESTTEKDLSSIFGEFGSIDSVAVIRDEAGNSKCFGFVNFENAEGAAKSVEVLNGRIINDKEWYVGRAQKKSEREQLAKEALERSLGMNNLYVKNIDDTIDNDKLKEFFSPFGTITSCKIMCDPKGISKGFGFVAFSTAQEASRAAAGLCMLALQKERKLDNNGCRCWVKSTVEQLEPETAAKVMGMLLEMDQTEVLLLLESPEALKAKVTEAMEVLRSASQQQASIPAEQLSSLSLNE